MRFRIRSLWPLGIALAGMAAGHWLGYAVSVPNPAHRSQVLAQTGHQCWGLLVAVSAVAGAGAMAWILARSFADGAAGRASALNPPRLAVRICALQLLLFAALESVERVLAHNALPLAPLTARPFLIGLGVQVVVGVIATFVVRALACLARAAGQWRRRPFDRVATLVPRIVRVTPIPVRVSAGASGLRGPPSW